MHMRVFLCVILLIFQQWCILAIYWMLQAVIVVNIRKPMCDWLTAGIHGHCICQWNGWLMLTAPSTAPFPQSLFITLPPSLSEVQSFLTVHKIQSTVGLLIFRKFNTRRKFPGNFRKFSLIVNITDNRETSVDLNETMHAMPLSTINHGNSVLMLLLVHRGAVAGDRKWKCKQIYRYLEGLYCIFSKNFRKFPDSQP